MIALVAVLMCIIVSGLAEKNYAIKLLAIDQCPDFPASKGPVTWSATLFDDKTGRRLVNGTVKIPFDIDEHVNINMEVSKIDESGNKASMVNLFKEDLCKVAHEYFHEFTVIALKAVGVKNPNVCPIPADTFTVYNYVIPLDMIEIPAMYGKYVNEVKMLKGKEIVSCAQYVVEIVEK